VAYFSKVGRFGFYTVRSGVRERWLANPRRNHAAPETWSAVALETARNRKMRRIIFMERSFFVWEKLDYGID
jgi:hypothetical protein